MLVLLLVSLLTAVNLMMRSWRDAQTRITLASAGRISLDRMMHDIRAASSVDLAGSSFGTTSGALKLNSTDSSGVATTTSYSLRSGVLVVGSSTTTAVSLLPRGVEVTNFTLYEMVTANSTAIRVTLALKAATTTSTTSATFYDTAVMRGTY
jgi:hypothetical protein